MTRSLTSLAALVLPMALTAQTQNPSVDQAQMARARELAAKLSLENRLAAQLGTLTNVGKVDEDCLSKDKSPSKAEQYRDCQARAERDRATLEPILGKRLPAARARLLEAAAIAYAQQFSPDDLNALVAFYRTPAGQHVAAAGPALDRAFAKAVADVDEQLMIDVLGDAQKELRK